MDSMGHRVSVFIDGSNFYFKVKSLGILNQFDFLYRDFCRSFASNKTKIFIKYFIGEVRTQRNNPKSHKLYKSQLKLFGHLTRLNVEIYKGQLLKSDGKYHEKGVDVQIATDILIGAYENLYDTCYLVSSDSDLVPAIKKARDLGKQIVYVGFKHQVSYSLLQNASQSKLLTKADLLPFVS